MSGHTQKKSCFDWAKIVIFKYESKIKSIGFTRDVRKFEWNDVYGRRYGHGELGIFKVEIGGCF